MNKGYFLQDTSDVFKKITFHPLGKPAFDRWVCKHDQVWEILQQIEDDTFSGFPMKAISDKKVGFRTKE